ncbi:MAG: hypothetical protein HYV39_02230 [Candidatus Levybacteria bacterium]|nr:hypothetical protein [Candidatus Levybacteria bacterium]
MDLPVLKVIQRNFVKELETAKSGKKSSLSFIVNQLPTTALVKDGQLFQVLSIGGGVTKVALIKKQKGTHCLLKQLTFQQPPFKTLQDFLSCVETHLAPSVTTLALNFAQAITPVFKHNRLDGILLNGTKESAFKGLIGKAVGQTIEAYFAKKGRRITVSLANDAVCLLLSGLIKYPWRELAGGIVGTGVNFSFFTTENHIINLEAGNFNKFPQTEEGKLIDKASVRPGSSLFEKETSGAYLYKHFNHMIEKQKVSFPPLSETKELDIVMLTGKPAVSKLAQNTIRQSAQLIACQIAGITRFKQTDITFVMEGSLFWKGLSYKQIVEETVKKLVPEYTVTFVEIPNSPIIGATKLVS